MKYLVLIFTTFLIVSCNEYPNSPDEVVLLYTNLLKDGDCEDALKYCSGSALETVYGTIESGCEPYETQIDSVICKAIENKAKCDCYETRDQFGQLDFPYELEKIDGLWKITINFKDIGIDE